MSDLYIIGLPVAMLNYALSIVYVEKGQNGGPITKKALRVPSPCDRDDHLIFEGRGLSFQIQTKRLRTQTKFWH